ncbi:hypothetical protein SNK04_013773 [Fusarium graminearum]
MRWRRRGSCHRLCIVASVSQCIVAFDPTNGHARPFRDELPRQEPALPGAQVRNQTGRLGRAARRPTVHRPADHVGATEWPRLDSLLAIANYFHCSLDELVHQDMENAGGPSQPVGFSDATMTQAVELLHMLAELRPDDQRFRKVSWRAIQVTAKAITKAEGSQKDAVRMILEELLQE